MNKVFSSRKGKQKEVQGEDLLSSTLTFAASVDGPLTLSSDILVSQPFESHADLVESSVQSSSGYQRPLIHQDYETRIPNVASKDHLDAPSHYTRVVLPSTRPLVGPSVLDASVAIQSNNNTYNLGEGSTFNVNNGPTIINQSDNYDKFETATKGFTRSLHAEFDIAVGTARGPCTPGTRTAILKDLMDWAIAGMALLYWMNGMAGTGKTTIIYSFCQLLREAGLLGASFFCSRSIPDCRDINLVLFTIILQLSNQYPALREPLAAVLAGDPDIQRRELAVQLRKLIIDPWNAKKGELPKRLVVVIDALDECDKDYSAFIEVLFNHVNQLPFKIIMASRPEPSILRKLERSTSHSTFILHEVEASLVKEDIARYIKMELKKCLTTPPLRSHVMMLADRSDRFFIYAATLCRFIQDEDGDPSSRLEALLRPSASNPRDVALSPINTLYKGILERVLHPGRQPEETRSIKRVLDTVICAREPLTRKAMAGLLGWNGDEVEKWLRFLRSVIFVPESEDQGITIFHASFADFMLDSLRSTEFHCSSEISNLDLVERCLVVMARELHQNMCQVDGQPPNESIPHEAIESHISPSLQYAVIYWGDHWGLSGRSEQHKVVMLLAKLMQKHALNWFECLSLLGRLSASIKTLDAVLNLLDSKDHLELASLIHHLWRLIQHIYDSIKDNASQVYFSLLTWIPTNSPIRLHYDAICQQAPRVVCGLSENWAGPERVINTDSVVTRMAVSADGSHLVYGLQEGTQAVRMWNMRTQTEEGISEMSNCGVWRGQIAGVAISSNRTRVIVGRKDKLVRVWDTTTRSVVHTLQCDKGVQAVATSPDDKWIASGDHMGSLKIWDATTGTLFHTLEGHVNPIMSVAFHPNSTALASASRDRTARIWDLQTGKMKHILRGHTYGVTCVAYSPDGTMVITGSHDTARLWSAAGRKVRVFRSHSHCVNCVAFLTDGKRVATGSDDNMLRVWSVATGAVVYQFAVGDSVRSLAVFPDGMKIASASASLISIWSLGDVESIRGDNRKKGALLPTIQADSVALSSDGRRILLFPSLKILDTFNLESMAKIRAWKTYRHGTWSKSGGRIAAVGHLPFKDAEVVSIWELAGDRVVRKLVTLKGHTKRINSVSFSDDEQRIVTASEDMTVRVWDVATGSQIHVLQHQGWVWNVAFSHDNRWIISDTRHILYRWDADSGEQLLEFESNSTVAIAFTLDDRHVISIHPHNIEIRNPQTLEIVHQYKGCYSYTPSRDKSFYVLHDDGWLCHLADFESPPRKVFWIPSSYRPFFNDDPWSALYEYHIHHIRELRDPISSGSGSTSSFQGIVICWRTKVDERWMIVRIPDSW